LFITPKTTIVNFSNILAKLQVHTRVEAAAVPDLELLGSCSHGRPFTWLSKGSFALG
jgi:hypothetical protein